MLLSALRSNQPSHAIVTSDPDSTAARWIPLLQTAFKNDIDQLLLPDGKTDANLYRHSFQFIHPSAVQNFIRTCPVNKVLRGPASTVATSAHLSPNSDHQKNFLILLTNNCRGASWVVLEFVDESSYVLRFLRTCKDKKKR